MARPHPGGTLTWTHGNYASMRGPIASVRIPVTSQLRSVTRSAAGYPGAPGAQEAVVAVGPGSHEFTGPAVTEGFPDT